MIQQINTRPRGSTYSTLPIDGPDIWSIMAGQCRRTYSLEVIQNPLRARMCGFGDKDRRPLAPAAVAKMVVLNEDGSVVDEKEVDCSFFLCTVDLWSGDGKQEMNLVLHPSSSDRYVPPNPLKSTASSSTASSSNRKQRGRSSSGQQTPTPSQSEPPTSEAPSPVSPQQGFPLPPAYSAAPPSADTPTWGYSAERNSSYQSLPSIQAFGEGWQNPPPVQGESEMAPFRPWTAEQGRAPSPVDNKEMSWPPREQSVDFVPAPQQGKSDQRPLPPLPRHTYTRTLVGPLSANATLLQDEHRKPGIFFLFQDLSVRTEGTFRLRMRLMNIGAPPAPDFGATSVHKNVSPVLAQTFTDPFTVFSAKRFPGVPDTTALSIAFGNQGQKLPLRNRHGSGKRRRRGNNSGSEDDSDGE